jgi:ribosomal protein S6E (S10)
MNKKNTYPTKNPTPKGRGQGRAKTERGENVSSVIVQILEHKKA